MPFASRNIERMPGSIGIPCVAPLDA